MITNTTIAHAVAPVLQVRGVSKRYGKVEALLDFDIDVAPGTVHGLLGPNGSGKTTALHVITGISRASEGEVLIAGAPVELKATRERVGFAPDDLPLPSMLTGLEYVRFHDRMRRRDDEGRAWRLAEVFGITAALERLVGEYSHGMKRKLQLVVATMHCPDLLVLDEPFRGLDPEAAGALRALLTVFTRSGGAVLLATHDMSRAQRHCARVEVVHAGRVVASGPPNELIATHEGAYDLEDVFMRVTGRQPVTDMEDVYGDIFPSRNTKELA